tara:strand:- start:2058 stop:2495 length:438 start_codon:yes stop_codon:yes gene_type:complete
MPVTFTNNWKNILDKVQSTLRTEFGGSAPVFVGRADDSAGTQYFRLAPVSSEITELYAHGEQREFTINIFFYFDSKEIGSKEYDHILRFVSRTEALMHDNIKMTLADSTTLFDCRMDTCTLDVGEPEDPYTVQWEFICSHLGNTA